jgi:ABC-2 type transport system ATP-binding protein
MTAPISAGHAGPPAPVGHVGAVVEGHGVVKRWGHTVALDGASFTVRRGITGLLGSNGAGKTTLFGLLLGLHRPDDGELLVLGHDPAHTGSAVRERLGYSPEHHELPRDTRAHDFVRHIAELHGLPPCAATSRASDALWSVGLGEERYRPLGTMSTGQRQRVKLAQAIAHDPALVLLDEPTDGLDPVQRDDMLTLIRRVGTEFGIDVILSSHLLEEVERVCDGAVILTGGRVAAAGTLAELTGVGHGVLVEVDEHSDQVARVLIGRGFAVDVDGDRLLVDHSTVDKGAVDTTSGAAAPDRLYDEIRDAVAVTGVGLRRLTNRTVRLEEVFLEVDR